jgi:hypothetical protein
LSLITVDTAVIGREERFFFPSEVPDIEYLVHCTFFKLLVSSQILAEENKVS